MPPPIWKRLALLSLLASAALPLPAQQAPAPAEPIQISRASGSIEVDGALGDPGWSDAARVETFYETNPGDNVPPKVKTVVWLAYDARFFYAAFEFSDPDPRSIRAPFGDHDNVPGYTDYGGVILDTRNDGKTAAMFLVNPHNIQYDAISSDTSGEDNSPDFYWDSAARIGPAGWTLEIRIPFSSLRYDSADPQTWGILLYRNRPREFRTQMFSSVLPRGSNCFICHSRKVVGLTGLPSGRHAVLAPYSSGRRTEEALGDPGTQLVSQGNDWEGGLDAKWIPNADTAIDATLNPDFSQVESDVAQITANERFALFFPEKRPFFLEGLDLFATPVQAVYTRTITSPRWGLRSTGQLANTLYTVLVGDDRGGGSVIVPGPQSSDLAPQDFTSRELIGRARRDFGRSFLSLLVTDRENEGDAHNRVLGPDFEWRPTGSDTVRGQLLLSDSRNPDRPDLFADWQGQDLASHAFDALWNHSTRTWDWDFEYKDIGDEFRADLGFLPQVGIRDGFFSLGRSFFPAAGILSRFRPSVRLRNVDDQGGDLLLRRIIPGLSFEGIWNSFAIVERRTEKVRAGSRLFDLDYWVAAVEMTPSHWLGGVALEVTTGDDVDFEGERPARGTTVAGQATLRPTDHLELRVNGSRRWLDVAPTPSGEGPKTTRLFTAEVARLRATYTFNARSFLRLVGQRVTFEQDGSDESLTASALFAYKLNWQTVLFVGYGDERALALDDRLAPTGREVFFKISYAYQR
jgi:Domain of unknown function (DUF5916)